jgi:hypothetical protein
VVFNPIYGLYTYVGVNFFFNRGGHIHKFINVMSAWADPTAQPLLSQLPMWIADAIWVLANLYVVTMESKELIHLVRHSKERCYKAIWDEYVSVWNMIDWVSIVVAFLIVQFFISMRVSIGNINEQLVIMMDLQGKSREANLAANNTFVELVTSMAAQEKLFRRALSVYPMIVMLRLFKSFKAQKKLALVTDTLAKASQDLLHFSIVFFTVFFCMIVNGLLFFGQDLTVFGSVPRAVHACFRAMFGDYDWDLMKEIGFTKAGIWFWIFMIVMYLILLNMLLAIVMDAYSYVSTKAKNADALWTEVSTMMRRARETRKGERVRLNDVYAKFLEDFGGDEHEMLKCTTKIKPDDVCAKMNRMPMKQAKRTLVNALKKKWAADEEKNHMDEETMRDEIKKLLDAVENRAKTIMEDADYVKNRLKYYDRLQIPGDPEYDFHFGEPPDVSAGEPDLPNAIDSVSSEIGNMFITNMSKIEAMQGSMEKQQEEFHKLISEMQMMVDQETRCIQSMSEHMSSLGSPRRLEEPEAHT